MLRVGRVDAGRDERELPHQLLEVLLRLRRERYRELEQVHGPQLVRAAHAAIANASGAADPRSSSSKASSNASVSAVVPSQLSALEGLPSAARSNQIALPAPSGSTPQAAAMAATRRMPRPVVESAP